MDFIRHNIDGYGIKLYMLIIYMKNTYQISHIIVTDIAGRVVYSTSGTGREQAVNLDGKASGIYFVHITAGDKSYTEKLIVK